MRPTPRPRRACRRRLVTVTVRVTTQRIADVHAWLRDTGARRLPAEEALAAFAIAAIQSESGWDSMDVQAEREAQS